MSSGLGLLNDKTCYEENSITRIDPRIKLGFSFLFLIAIITAKTIFVPVLIIVFMLSGLLALKINSRVFLVRGLPALLIAVTILITQVFLYGKTPVFTIKFLGIQFIAYYEGFYRGLLLMCRVLAGITTMLFLTMSTAINKLIFAAKWFHVPNAVLEVLTITYRYIFVLFEEMATIKNARKTRLGFSSYRRTIESFGDLSGIIIIRTLDKSERLYKSMKSRGYNGQNIIVHYEAKMMKNDWIIAFGLTVTLGLMIVVSLLKGAF